MLFAGEPIDVNDVNYTVNVQDQSLLFLSGKSGKGSVLCKYTCLRAALDGTPIPPVLAKGRAWADENPTRSGRRHRPSPRAAPFLPSEGHRPCREHVGARRYRDDEIN